MKDPNRVVRTDKIKKCPRLIKFTLKEGVKNSAN